MTRKVILTTESRKRREETITMRVYLTGLATIPIAKLRRQRLLDEKFVELT